MRGGAVLIEGGGKGGGGMFGGKKGGSFGEGISVSEEGSDTTYNTNTYMQ